MMYVIVYSDPFLKQIKKLDNTSKRLIKNWIEKNLIDTVDPRQHGKPLKGNLLGIWRYRVGDYRLFAEIRDNELIIEMLEVGHRREIYRG